MNYAMLAPPHDAAKPASTVRSSEPADGVDGKPHRRDAGRHRNVHSLGNRTPTSVDEAAIAHLADANPAEKGSTRFRFDAMISWWMDTS